MKFSTEEIQQITGLKLSQTQADALLGAAYSPNHSSINDRTARVLYGLGLLDAVISLGPRGGRHVRRFATERGIAVARRLNDAIEYGVTAARFARAAGCLTFTAFQTVRDLSDARAEQLIATIEADRQAHPVSAEA